MSDALNRQLNPEFLRALAAEERHRARNKFARFFPDTGPYRRELYPKHLEFMRAGHNHRERCFMAANRIGKSETGAFEVTAHATGRYPDWWEGHRFDRPIKIWACGETNKKVREVTQQKLFGPPNQLGTGMLPYDAIHGEPTKKSGIPEAYDAGWIKHASGGLSRIVLKSYEEGWQAYDSDEIDLIWLDEECDERIYSACITRTMTTRGLVILTFTPLEGRTEVVEGFLDEDKRAPANRYYVNAEWGDVPHLDSAEKEQLLASIIPYQREARSKGIPVRGSGAIFPIA
jgi:phage terminase large subunit-like protein